MYTDSSPVNPQPGDFAVVPMAGEIGKLVKLGEWLNGTGFDEYQHAIIYVGDGMIVEAEPGGARHVPLPAYPYSLWSTGRIPLTDDERKRIVNTALSRVGVPYSFLDYFALAAHRLHIPAPGLRGYIASTDHMICSQLVDLCYQHGGVPLFSDGRWNGYVTPADLARLLYYADGASLFTDK